MLESRLDNMVYRIGFAASRIEARQLIRHGHFLVNGKKVDIPSCQLKPNDVITLREKSRKIASIKECMETARQRGVPQWLQLQPEEFQGTVLSIPRREEITMPMREQLIVELYSK